MLTISKHPLGVNGATTLFMLLWFSSANAHPEFSPTAVNRYLKLSLVSSTQLRLAYTVMFGAAPAAAQRKLADSNGDGRLDDPETTALAERLKKEVAAGLDLRIEGAPIHPVFEAVTVGLPALEVSPEPFSVDLVAFIPLVGRGPHTVRVDDTTVLPQLGETEIRIEEGPTTRLLTAHRGESGSERETRFVFSGPKWSLLEDRSVTLKFVAIGAPREQQKPRTWMFGGVLLAALSGLGALAFRYRNMKG
jgi:hypothetical protein